MSLIQKIKNYLADRQIKKVLSTQKRVGVYPDFDKVKTILILFKSDLNEKNLFVRTIMEDLKKHGKKVSAWGLIDKKDTELPVFIDYRLITSKELSFNGLPNDSIAGELAHTEYDMVIQLCCDDLLALDYLLAVARSPFKISKLKPYKGISDFMLEINEKADEKYMLEQILFYLNSIQPKAVR
ncbi:MAG: hypothetical protein LBR81_04440 [Prevotellaceae bacterium]|jgi:hypothetical protein|nr:hypothetical protein [Prevotellaceae bacterium]